MKSKIKSAPKKISDYPELNEVTLKYRLDLLRISQQYKDDQLKRFPLNSNLNKHKDDHNNDKTIFIKREFKGNTINNLEKVEESMLKDDYDFKGYIDKKTMDFYKDKLYSLSVSKNQKNKKSYKDSPQKMLYLSPLAKISNLISNKNESDNCLNKSSISLEKFLLEEKKNHLREEAFKLKAKTKNKRGIVLFNNDLSPERLVKIKQMRNYQVFGNKKKDDLFPLINARIIKLENEGKSNINLNESFDNDEISRIFINGKEQLIKNYLIRKNVRNDTVSYDTRKSIKISKNGKVNLHDFCVDNNVTHQNKDGKYDYLTMNIHDRLYLDSSFNVNIL